MNSLDDFAQLRPDEVAATTEDLDAIWSGVAEDDPIEGRDDSSAGRHGRRRFALIGAAAAVALGVVAIASVSNRADAPPAVSESSLAVTSSPDPDPDPTVATVSTIPVAVVEAGEPPLWGIAEDGWTLEEFDDRTNGPLDMVRLFAGPDGLATSWVAIVSGMSEPLLPIGVEPGDGASSLSLISSQRVATEDGSVAVIAGGVSDDQAMSVFRAVQNGEVPPDGFVETESADAAVRTIRYRFVDGDGQTIDIETQGAGTPRYETERSVATADEFWDATASVDDASIAYVGEYTLLLRNGFWVTRVVTSAPDDAPTTFARLASLVQPVSLDEWEAARSTAPTGFSRLALGDSVMLGAASELVDAGFVVDAVESRTVSDGVETLRQLREQSRLPDTVVISLGTNGSVTDQEMIDLMALLADVDQVVVLTVRLDGAFSDIGEANSTLIRSLPDTYPNVDIVDWATLGDECPGDCFAEDDLHLTDEGRRYYTDLVVAATT